MEGFQLLALEQQYTGLPIISEFVLMKQGSKQAKFTMIINSSVSPKPSGSKRTTGTFPIFTMTKPIVFFIDDEPDILQAILRITRHEQYKVETFDDPLKALAELVTREVAVVVADQRMPGITGTELLEKVRIQCPNTIRMILSGDAEIDSVLSAINKGKIFHFITKPCGDDDLKSAINEAIKQHFLLVENKRLAGRYT